MTPEWQSQHKASTSEVLCAPLGVFNTGAFLPVLLCGDLREGRLSPGCWLLPAVDRASLETCQTQGSSSSSVWGRRSLLRGRIHKMKKANSEMRMGQLRVIRVRMPETMVRCAHPGMLMHLNTPANSLHRSTSTCGLKVWPQALSPKHGCFRSRERPISVLLKLDPHGVGFPGPRGEGIQWRQAFVCCRCLPREHMPSAEVCTSLPKPPSIRICNRIFFPCQTPSQFFAQSPPRKDFL